MLTLRRIEQQHVIETLSFIAAYIERALEHDHGEMDVDTVIERLVTGEFDLWIAFDPDTKSVAGAVTTSFIKYPLKWSLELITMSVDAPREDWQPLIEELETWAAIHGCCDIEFLGRMGWAKTGNQIGFRPTHVKMTREVGSVFQ